MKLYIKSIVITKNGKTERTAFHRRLSVVKENDELLGIVKLLLGREEKQAAVCDVWFSSKVFIGEERYFLKGTKREGDSLFSVVVYKKGSAVPCDEEYFSAVRQSEEIESALFFDSFKRQDYPHRLRRYRDTEKYYPDCGFAQTTRGYGMTRSFRAFVSQYIRDFKPIRLRENKELFLKLSPFGEFEVECKDSDGKIFLSETEDVLYHYMSFISVADFWDRAEKMRDYNRIKKPLVICSFLERIDISVDITNALKRTNSLDRQTIIFLGGRELSTRYDV